ncbi:MAG: hypothetical protein MZV63_05455 [Marinilabiliales bacterium]|nr:hypothetical protein [Marinilabiliales bacterium]
MFRLQKRVVLGNCGCYDPESIEEYIARGGYRTFLKTIRNYTHEEVCDIIETQRTERTQRRRVHHRTEVEVCSQLSL